MRRGNNRLRVQITEEAARLMYEEGVKEYFTAKRMAAKRILGAGNGSKQHRRPGGLPSNGEIQAALLRHAELAEGETRTEKLAGMRIVAFDAMSQLVRFSPKLIGSVSTGHVRHGSDIDVQLFADDADTLREHLDEMNWIYEEKQVSIFKFGEIREYLHFYIDAGFMLEITLYPRRELRYRPKSSTDGKPIGRLALGDLQAIIQDQHPEEWEDYLRFGIGTILVELANQTPPNPFQSLVSD